MSTPHPIATPHNPDALRQEARRAWARYQATGLHVTGAETDDWLARLEARQDVEPPESHG